MLIFLSWLRLNAASAGAVTKAVKPWSEGMLEAKKDKDDGGVTLTVLTQEALNP